MSHARKNASSSHRWMKCPGSISKCADIPERRSPAATEGTGVHALISEHLLKNKSVKVGQVIKFDDGGTPEKLEITQDHLDNADVMCERVRWHMSEMPGAKLYLEQEVHLGEEMYGTSDAIIVARSQRKLIVMDYKNGVTPVHIGDEDDPNSQLMYYAAGACNKLDWRSFDVITIEIVQPRCVEVPSVQSLQISVGVLKQWLTKVLLPAAEAVDKKPTLVAGEHCKWCPAIHDCAAVARQVESLAVLDFEEFVPSLPVPYDPVQLSKILKFAPVIDEWLKACEVAALEQLKQGKPVPGYKLVQKRSNRKWPTDDPKELADLLNNHLPNGQMIRNTVRLMHPPELLSPAQLEKIIDKKIIDKVAVKPDGGVTVTAETDRRPAITVGNDFEDFI